MTLPSRLHTSQLKSLKSFKVFWAWRKCESSLLLSIFLSHTQVYKYYKVIRNSWLTYLWCLDWDVTLLTLLGSDICSLPASDKVFSSTIWFRWNLCRDTLENGDGDNERQLRQAIWFLSPVIPLKWNERMKSFREMLSFMNAIKL